jgi:hypothetical protein
MHELISYGSSHSQRNKMADQVFILFHNLQMHSEVLIVVQVL